MDDLAIAESVNMGSQLTAVPVQNRPLPDTFRARTDHKFETSESQVFDQLRKVQDYAVTNKMKLNLAKTKLMLFNPCRSKDFMPEIAIDKTRLDLVEQTKLLGVVLTSNLSWEENTQYISERCNGKIWMIKRLKNLGANQDDLLDVFFKQIRSLAEFSAPVWNSSLTGDQVASIERIQKTVLHIILGEEYKSYNSALKVMGLEKLSNIRRKICSKFAKKSQKHDKFSKWFKPNHRMVKRIKQNKFCPVICKTLRFEKCPLSYLTKLLNNKL